MVVKMLARRLTVEINRTHCCARDHKRDTKQGANTQFSKSLYPIERFIAGDVVYNHSNAIPPNTLYHGSAYSNRMAGAAHPIPVNVGTELAGAVEKQYSPTLGRNQVEDPA